MMWSWLGVDTSGPSKVFRPSPEAIAVGAEFRLIDMCDWWFELAKYRFMLSPLGSGIQANKNIEALIALTIPIVPRMGYGLFGELVEIRFPIVTVGDFTEVTPENTSRWWDGLSPRLAS